DADDEYEIRYRFVRGRLELPDFDDVTPVSATPDRVVLSTGIGASGATGRNFVERPFDVARYGGTDDVFIDGPLGPVRLTAQSRFPDPDSAVAQGSLLAPMPGSVVRVGAAVGDQVTAGQPLIWLEAMKMEHTITAPGGGVLAELNVAVGQQVDVGSLLARVEDTANPEGE
ncbi:MAG: propionyl-CoA carboxylase alpha chain, partial [Mycobacterium sp.]|nr:propionyl-CoA carboxylase alpha chain [Mycobacterium sp.]